MSGGHCTHPTGGPAIRLKSKDELCFVKQRENQIVVTIGAVLHFIHVEL